jgi:3',5'-cyclic-AMP phosphodiesterase
MSRPRAWRVLQITDLHLRKAAGATLLGVDTEATLLAVLDQALADSAPLGVPDGTPNGRPDALLLTGDIAHDPKPDVYRRLRALLDERCPVPRLVLCGNHDQAGPLAAAFGDADSLRLGDWAVLGFDSHADHQPQAEFDAARRSSLDLRLDGCDARHVLLTCHHPPLPVGAPWLDRDRLPHGEDLLESWRARGTIRALVFGHVHQQVDADWRGLQVLGTPSTCFQFAPGSRRFSVDRSVDTGRPGYRWLELHPDGTLTSSVRRCDLTLNIDLTDGP